MISKHVEWVYERPEGDLTLYAETREDALRCLREDHGLTGLDPAKMKLRGRRLTDAIDGPSSTVNSERAQLVKMGAIKE